MQRYENYTTTVVGAHSVPRWYEALDRLVAAGQLSPGDFDDVQLRATQAAILEQEIAGIDIITGGEMHRRTHNRHSPPNAMLNHFWQKIPSFQGATKPKPITAHDPHVFHPAAICRGPIVDTVDLGLVEEFRTVSSFAPASPSALYRWTQSRRICRSMPHNAAASPRGSPSRTCARASTRLATSASSVRAASRRSCAAVKSIRVIATPATTSPSPNQSGSESRHDNFGNPRRVKLACRWY
jgi:hypothetical protein